MSQSFTQSNASTSNINPEQPSSTIKSNHNKNYAELYEQLKLQSHMIRVSVNLHLKHAENIWKLELTEL